MPQLTLSGGINNVKHPGMLAPNEQVSIVNIAFDGQGKLGILKDYEYYSYLQAEGLTDLIFTQGQTIIKIYQWKPAYLPINAYSLDSYKDVIVVFYIDSDTVGKVKIVYRTDVATYTSLVLTTDAVTTTEVHTAADTWQFLFVDGRTNHRARRISINQNGVTSISYVGMSAIHKQAVVKGIYYDSTDGYATGIGQGNAFGYRYAFRNEYGESSPISPMTVCDLLDYHKRGTFTEGEYTHDLISHGSIKEIDLEIDKPNDAVYLDIFRCDADGNENIPFNTMRIVQSINIKNSPSPVIIKDTHPYGVTEVNLLRDDSPMADCVALASSVVYYGNATNTLNFPYEIAMMWRVFIDNNNPITHINKFVEFDLFDDDVKPANDTTASIDESLTDLGVTAANFRFMDSDMITPLESYWYDADLEVYTPFDGSTVNIHRMIKLRIPERLANQTHVVYLVIAGERETTPKITINPTILDFGTVYPAID